VSFVKPGITVTEESAKLSQLVETYDLRLFAGGRQCKGRFLGTPSGVPGVKVNGSRIRVDYGVRSPAVLGLGLTTRVKVLASHIQAQRCERVAEQFEAEMNRRSPAHGFRWLGKLRAARQL